MNYYNICIFRKKLTFYSLHRIKNERKMYRKGWISLETTIEKNYEYAFHLP